MKIFPVVVTFVLTNSFLYSIFSTGVYMSFPENFAWGAATAAYQIEGAAYEDDKGLSVWDMFCKKPGAVFKGDNADIACDHYHRFEEDVRIMHEIGLKAYRMSISWPRVIPGGIGKINPKGFDFYSRLVDSLLDKNIKPWITLFHWDYPYELYCKGGWLNPDSSEWFSEYASRVMEKLSDRVENWMTFNEPNCFIGLGHLEGSHAPGDKLGFRETLRAAHNVLLSHGKAVKTIRSLSKKKCSVGFAPLGDIKIPYSSSSDDIDAAKKEMFSIKQQNFWQNTWWMDPVYLGAYPEDGLKLFEKFLPAIGQDDMKIINQKLDFFGFNNYYGAKIKSESGIAVTVPSQPGSDHTAFASNNDYWGVSPEALYWGPKFFFERYGLPVVITENGMSNVDWISLDGKVHDPQRIDFIARYLGNLKKASDDGVEVIGYFVWSIMDNFEWAEAFKQRFGLVYVDYNDGRRIMKDSAFWYKKVIASNGDDLSMYT
jgi:beta-glucosidase